VPEFFKTLNSQIEQQDPGDLEVVPALARYPCKRNIALFSCREREFQFLWQDFAGKGATSPAVEALHQ
jgi:hypothetical protein